MSESYTVFCRNDGDYVKISDYEKLQQQIEDMKKNYKHKDELFSAWARIEELEAQLRQETARLNAADKEIEQLREQVDFERNKTSTYTWKKGQLAIEKLERIEQACLDGRQYESNAVENCLKILADWRGND